MSNRVGIVQRAWSVAEIEKAREMWLDQNLSAGVIAAVFGVTRNSIIGLCHRNGWHKGRPERAHTTKPREPKANAKERSFLKRVAAAKVANPIKRERSVETPPIITEPPPVDGVRFLDLTSRHCRYIPGQTDSAQTVYCGGTVTPGQSYCAHHRALMYVGKQTMRPMAIPALRRRVA